ncbi:MAG: ADP-ribosylglycohydrolase family protein [Muribaculaceae bacterium]|nr:ADP-ribosylglycohydrolase family protein [Muribaculaceae bacterium]
MKDRSLSLMGAICGDIMGSPYEFWRARTKRYDFNPFPPRARFTDDTVMSIAEADWIMNGGDLSGVMQKWGHKYPNAGFGGMFRKWLEQANPEPYNSFGNGSAMRVSPVGCAFDTLEETLQKAKESAEVSHNHPEGIKGAQATAAAIFMARTGNSKEEIRNYISETFGYNLNRTCDEIRPEYKFDSTCQGSVPESIICFLESKDYEDCVRLAVSMGGDTDTMGAIAGSIAAAYYGEIPEEIQNKCWDKLPEDIRNIIEDFREFTRRQTT